MYVCLYDYNGLIAYGGLVVNKSALVCAVLNKRAMKSKE